MTKTEELLEDFCKDCPLNPKCCDECKITPFKDHLAPLIAKERIIDMLRKYEDGDEVRDSVVVLFDNKLKLEWYPASFVYISEPDLVSTKKAWVRVIKEEPDLVKTALGWDKL